MLNHVWEDVYNRTTSQPRESGIRSISRVITANVGVENEED